MEHCEGISLDEYIRRSKMKDQFSLLNLRKRERKNIDSDQLNSNLDDYIRNARAESPSPSSCQDSKAISRNGKFDRRSMRSDDESDEEENQSKAVLGILDEDVVMETEEDAENQEKDDVLQDLLQFQTVESKYGVRVRSQQWRLLAENLEDRPEGMKRLEFLPLDDNERFHRVQYGRVNKNRSRTSSSSSNFSNRSNMTLEAMRAHGTFVEKGSFTIKFGDRNGDGQKGIVGIERAKRINQQVPEASVNNPAQSGLPAININMNWDGFFKGIKSTTTNQESGEEKLNIAAKNLLQLLRDTRESEIEN